MKIALRRRRMSARSSLSSTAPTTACCTDMVASLAQTMPPAGYDGVWALVPDIHRYWRLDAACHRRFRTPRLELVLPGGFDAIARHHLRVAAHRSRRRIGRAADLPLFRRQSHGRDGGERARQSLGVRL